MTDKKKIPVKEVAKKSKEDKEKEAAMRCGNEIQNILDMHKFSLSPSLDISPMGIVPVVRLIKRNHEK